MLKLTTFHASDRHAEMGNALQEIQGPVERVDNPRVFGRRMRFSVLLADDPVIRISFVQYVDDYGLDLAIDVGNKIVVGFLLDMQTIDAIHGPGHYLTGLARSA